MGRWHHFDLAKYLHEHGMLAAFFCAYPRWKLLRDGLPPEKTFAFPWLMSLRSLTTRLGLTRRGVLNPLTQATMVTLDRHAARRLPPCDALLALSGQGLSCGRTIRGRGGVYVCDRASSHARYQANLLRHEYARWGQSYDGAYERLLAREEAEYELADAITVPSQFARRSFVEMGVPPDKVISVPFGVSVDRFGPIGNPDPDRFDVLFVGQISFRKGVPYLLEAFRRLRHPRKRLLLVGRVYRDMARYFESHRPPDEVDILGYQSVSRLSGTMSRSHVMVLPSIEEGLARVQAEALACGCPVIGTPNTGAEDLFEDGREGFIVPPRDAERLCERLQQLADEPERREAMSRAGLARVQELGGWSRYCEHMAATLQALVREPP